MTELCRGERGELRPSIEVHGGVLEQSLFDHHVARYAAAVARHPDHETRAQEEFRAAHGQDLPYRLEFEPVVAGVENLAHRSQDIRIMIKVRPGKRWEIAPGVRRRIKKRFDTLERALTGPEHGPATRWAAGKLGHETHVRGERLSDDGTKSGTRKGDVLPERVEPGADGPAYDRWLGSGDRFRDLVETMNEGLVVADAVDRIVFANGRAVDLLGIEAESAKGRCFRDLVSPEDRSVFDEHFDRRRRGETSRYEIRFLGPDGRSCHAMVSGKPLLDAEGRFAGSFAVLTDITERREAEQALLESEARLRDIVEHSTNLFYAHTPDHVLTYMSPQTRAFFGCEPEEAMVRWTELVTDHPANRVALRMTEEAIRTGKAQPPYELQIRGRYGRPRWVEVREAPVLEDGRVTGIVGALTDITERRRMERLLRIELQLGLALGSVYTKAQAFEKALDAARQIDEIDAAWLYRITTEEGDFTLAAHDGLSDAAARRARRISAADPRAVVVVHALDGHAAYLDDDGVPDGLRCAAMFPIRHEGRLLGALSLASRTVDRLPHLVARVLQTIASQLGPVISRFEAQESLRTSEATLRSLVGAAPAGMGLVRDRVFQWVNDHMTRLTGYGKEELLQQSSRLIYPSEEEYQRVGEEKYDQIRESGIGTVEAQWQRKDGTLLDVMLSSAALDPGDVSAGVVFTAWDVTELKRAQAEQLRLETQVQHAQKLESLGVLAGGIAHDFNNILHAILGNAKLASEHLTGDERARRHVREIERAASRAGELCHQMLAYSGRGSFVIGPIHVGDVVREIADILSVSLSKKAKLEIEVEADLPAVEADGAQIGQIVVNLVTNAAEAIGDKSGSVRVNVFATDRSDEALGGLFDADELGEERYVVLRVKDTGCGMDAATRRRMFDPFFSTKFAGRGLGLSAVQGIVHGHGGAIAVSSRPARGTTVTVLLPAGVAVEPVASPPPAEDRRSEAHGTVLLADDEPQLRSLGREMLDVAGFDVVAVEHGQRAVEVFAEKPGRFACVVLDLTMPVMDGEEAFHAIRGIDPKVPVVLCSGYSEQELRGRFAGDRPAAFQQKPFTQEALRRTLDRVM